jgi:hypothetical protein
LLVASFRCLQGVELMVTTHLIFFHVGSHVAHPIFPFSGRIWRDHAELTGRIFADSLTAIALLDNSVTSASIILASFLGHENTLITLS